MARVNGLEATGQRTIMRGNMLPFMKRLLRLGAAILVGLFEDQWARRLRDSFLASRQ